VAIESGSLKGEEFLGITVFRWVCKAFRRLQIRAVKPVYYVQATCDAKFRLAPHLT